MLTTNFAGLKLKNPVIAASATPTINARHMIKAAKGGAGAVISKTIAMPREDGRPKGNYLRPRFMLMNNSTGYDVELAKKDSYFTLFRSAETYMTLEEGKREIAATKDAVDIPVIASIGAAVEDYDEWVLLAKEMEAVGADALELNLHSLPSVKHTNHEIIKHVKEVVKIPIISKLMFNWEQPEAIGPKVEEAGSDAITAIGSFRFNALEIDIEKKEPMLSPTYLGSGGTWLKPIGLAYIAKLYETIKTPLSGVTGVANWIDAVKYILAGATTVQVCGAIYAKGHGVLGEIASGIERYCEEQGIDSIEELRGLATQCLVGSETLEWAPPIKAYVDENLCIGCKVCEKSCFWDAYDFSSGKAHVNAEKCDGCGVCKWVCPEDAITMRRY